MQARVATGKRRALWRISGRRCKGGDPHGSERGACAQPASRGEGEETGDELRGGSAALSGHWLVLASRDVAHEHAHIVAIEGEARREEGVQDDPAAPHVTQKKRHAYPLFRIDRCFTAGDLALEGPHSTDSTMRKKLSKSSLKAPPKGIYSNLQQIPFLIIYNNQ
jgi:hypothetical protein